MMYLFVTNTQLFSVHDVNRWTGVVWITVDVFISCLDSHSDGTHSLQRIHLIASNAKLLLICYDWSKNSSTSVKLSSFGWTTVFLKCRFESSQEFFIGVTHYWRVHCTKDNTRSRLSKGKCVENAWCTVQILYSCLKHGKSHSHFNVQNITEQKKRRNYVFVYNKFENSLQHALKSKKHPMLI